MMREKRQGKSVIVSHTRDTSNIHDYSHLMGFFYRTIRIVENGIKPAYVFDGKPPDLKAGVVLNFQHLS
jgi:5'-3' exonuclease